MKRITRAEIWGLSQGLLGRARNTLAPSLAAVGPNTYLNQNDFLKMLGAAFLVHALIFGVAAMMPDDRVTNIPVRALSFKLGDQDRVAAFAPTPAATPTIAAPSMSATASETWRAMPNVPAPVTPPPLKPIAPVEKVVEATKPIKPSKPQPIPEAKPVPVPVAAPAVAPTPQQYVREVGAPTPQAVAAAVAAAAPAGTPTGAVGGAGTENTMTAQSMQAIRARYEQEISAWIQRHKYYPADAGGREGRAIVRMRIDRAGNVRYYAIEQSAGLTALDLAALDMIRRANPVPAVPTTYPAGNLVEFLIPITFKAPQ